MDGQRKRIKNDDGWGGSWKNYMEAKQAKLDHQFVEGASNSAKLDTNTNQSASNIFKGVAIYVNGYTVPSADELRQLMMKYGGKYHVYYSQKLTTHIIATNLPNSKIANLREEIILKPEWITDSIKAGYRLSEEKFRLYNSNRNLSQPCLNFASSNIGQIPTTVFLNGCPSSAVKSNDSLHTHNSLTDGNIVDHSKTMPCIQICNDVRENFVKPESEKFLQQFYSKSRLHHISAMSSELKNFIKELKENSDGVFPGRERLQQLLKNSNNSSTETNLTNLLPISSRRIMHVDMDCFFVSVGLRNLPHFKGKPVVVTHAKTPTTQQGIGNENEKSSMSDIACCSYEARSSGVRNGMLLGKALELCPNLVTIPYDFDGYREVSRTLYKTVSLYTLDLEAVSCDELYIDCTSLITEMNVTPEQFAKSLRRDVETATGCTCSVGIGDNFLLARLATKKAKPNGVFSLLHEDCTNFIKNCNVRDLPGIGVSIANRLKELKVEDCSDLQKISLVTLQKFFGAKCGQTLYNLCRGIDNREIRKQAKRSSVSSEVNYGIRFQENKDLVAFLENLSLEVQSRLRTVKSKGKTVTLKLKVRKPEAPVVTPKFMGHGLCNNISRSVTMSVATSDAGVISKECINLFNGTNVAITDIRGVGIQVTKLVGEGLRPTSTSTETLENFVKLEEFRANCSINDSPTKKSPNKSPIVTPSSAKGSPRRGSPKQIVPFRYRSIEEHFCNHTSSTTSIVNPELTVKEDLSVVATDDDSPFNMNMSINELKQQLNSWISSHAAPLEDDVSLVSHFFQSLVTEYQLEKAAIVLKILNKLVLLNNTENWKVANEKIQALTHLAIKSYYGGHLEI